MRASTFLSVVAILLVVALCVVLGVRVFPALRSVDATNTKVDAIGAKVDSAGAKVDKIDAFFVSVANQIQGASPAVPNSATPNTNSGSGTAPAPQASADPYRVVAQAVVRLHTQWDRLENPAAAGGSGAAGPNFFTMGPPHGNSGVLNWSTTEDADRILNTAPRILESGYRPILQAQPIMMPPTPTSDLRGN